MPYLSKKRGLTQQPQVPVNLDRSLGLRRAVVMSLGRGQELVENVTVTTSDGSAISPDLFTSLGKSYDGNGGAYNSLISVPSWTNTTNEASLCLVFTGQMQIGWVAGAGSLTHFPFSSLLYCNTFWSGRWVNGISLLSGDSWDGPHVVVITVKDGRQKIFHNGRLWYSNTSTGGFTLPATLQIFPRQTSSPYGYPSAFFAWDKVLPDQLAISYSSNPWQIFKKQNNKIWIPSAGGGSSTNLIIQDSTHSLTSDNLDLSTSLLLTIQDSTHSLSSDSLFLSTDWLLTVQDSTHSLTSDNITLDITNSTNLTIQEATHSVTSDNLLITTEWLLDIASAAHALTSDNLNLSTALSIVIQKSIHSLTSDNITLDTSNTTILTIQDAVHNHIADNLGLTLDTWLVIADAVHTHLADSIDLGTELTLTIQSSTHNLTSDIIILSIPSTGSCPTVEEIVAAIMIQIEAKNYLTLPQFLSFK